MPSRDDHPGVQFEPLRPASRGRLVLGMILGPVLWLTALIVVAAILRYTSAIEIGLLVTLASFLLSLAALSVLRSMRLRQERRHAAGR